MKIVHPPPPTPQLLQTIRTHTLRIPAAMHVVSDKETYCSVRHLQQPDYMYKPQTLKRERERKSSSATTTTTKHADTRWQVCMHDHSIHNLPGRPTWHTSLHYDVLYSMEQRRKLNLVSLLLLTYPYSCYPSVRLTFFIASSAV